jgi:hypothetical protein
MKKPPIGLIPRSIWDFQRIDQISNAINRYIDAGYAIPEEWIEELVELFKRYNDGRAN